jgi:geranylgeranyl pyrophosphate synthase
MLDVPRLLGTHARAIEELLRKEVPPEQAPYLSEGVWYQFESGGKRLRPALCLLACETFGGDPRKALPFALATEIFHNFLLIHDDIEDGDTVRRDKATLWFKLGVPNAINIGDYLVAKAYRLVLSSPLDPDVNLRLARILSLVFERTVEGQALDINLRGRADIGLETYHRIVELKTAYYLALTWVGGAVVAGMDEPVIETLWDLGRCLGPAFQIRDDILDLTTGKGRGGEIGCDLREGKPSIFFAHIIDTRKGSGEDRRKLVEIVSRPREATTPEDVAWAIDFYRETGALDFADEEARRFQRRAEEVIERLPLDDHGREVFQAIGRFMVDRST